MRARLAAAAWSRTPDAMRARESLQREPALDDAAIGKLDGHADTARERLRRRARQRPAIAPAAVGRKLQDTKARDAAGERVSRRVFRCDVVEARPIEHLDPAVAQPIPDALAAGPR